MIPWYGLLILFPICCALVGWVTNVIAVRMIFFPIRPRRVLGLKFQGVLPKHHGFFAEEMAQVVTSDFMTTGELVEQLDAGALVNAVRPRLEPLLDGFIEQLRQMLPPAQREMLLSPGVVQRVKARLEEQVAAELPGAVERLHGQADQMVDLNKLIVDKLVELGPRRFVSIIQELGKGELFWIRVYGGLFGGLIGLAQFTVISVFPVQLSLVVVGAVVGAVTNFMAIKMLFWPRRARDLGPFRLQGMFPKRQEEIATELAHIAADQFIVPEKIFGRLAWRILPDPEDPELADNLEALLVERAPALQGVLAAIFKPEQREQLKALLAETYREQMPAVVEDVVAAAASQLDVHATLVAKVVALPKLRFEQFIRQLFATEEIYLIIYGAVVGAMMGAMQLALLVLRNWV